MIAPFLGRPDATVTAAAVAFDRSRALDGIAPSAALIAPMYLWLGDHLLEDIEGIGSLCYLHEGSQFSHPPWK